MESTDRSLQQQATQDSKTAGATGSQYGQTAGQIGGTLIPTLASDINNPNGLTPTQKSNELVAGEQGEGGATSGVTGQAGLSAVRTHNTGNLSAVLDAAQQHKGQQLSQNALGVENQSTDIANQKRGEALKGLSGLYGVDVSSQLKAMGLQDEDLNTAVKAGDSGWLQNATGVLGAVSGASKGPAAYA